MLKKLFLFLLPFIFVSQVGATDYFSYPYSHISGQLTNPTSIFSCNDSYDTTKGTDSEGHYLFTKNGLPNIEDVIEVKYCVKGNGTGDIAIAGGSYLTNFTNETKCVSYTTPGWYMNVLDRIKADTEQSVNITSNNLYIDCVYFQFVTATAEPTPTPTTVSTAQTITTDFGSGLVSGVIGISTDILPIAFAGLGSFLLFHFAWVVLGNLIAKKNGFPNAKSFNKATDDYFEKKGIL